MRKINFIATSFSTVLLASALMVSSCGGSSKNSLEEGLEGNQTSVKISKQELDKLIQSFPSPIETSIVIKNAGNPFNTSFLIPTKKIDRFISNYDKALAMGALGGDMGYINIYGKSFVAMEYLGAIRMLSKELDIDRFFEFERMVKMAKNSDNVDSLMQMSTESFNKMESYFREKGRNELSILIVFGTWLEGSYIIAELAKENQSEEMKNRVAEQKESVKNMTKVLSLAKADPFFAKLHNKVDAIHKLYDKVKIDQIIRQPEMQEVNGQLVFVDKSETKITADQYTIEGIISETIKFRNELLK